MKSMALNAMAARPGPETTAGGAKVGRPVVGTTKFPDKH